MAGPNILLIMTDQQRKDTLGCYGNRSISTPNIDKLAKTGVVLDREYCENPICIPSRCSMITGRVSRHHGTVLHNASLRDCDPTLSSLLTSEGYRTHFIGKPHFKSQGHHGSEESVQDWVDGKYDNWNGPYAGFETVEIVLGHCNIFSGHYGKWLCSEHSKELECFKASNLRPLDVSCGRGAFYSEIPEELHSSTYVGDRAVDFLDNMDSSKPFFCMVSFPSPHWPLIPPSEFAHMYDNVNMPDSVEYGDEGNKDNYPKQFKLSADGVQLPYDGNSQHVAKKEDIFKLKRLYWGEISLIDKNVGRILDALKENGLDSNTIVIFTTDHGEYMGDHGLMAKGGFLYEGFVNIPFIFSYPGIIPAGTRSNALFSHIDIAPTLVDFLNIDGSSLGCDGISQKDVLIGKSSSLRSRLTIHHPSQDDSLEFPDQHCLVTDEYKLVYYAGTEKGELYDLKHDPDELNNLYNKVGYESLQNKMIIMLLDELLSQKDRYAMYQQKTGNEIKPFIMKDDVWKEQFDKLK